MNEAHLGDSVVLLREIGELKESLRLEKRKKGDVNCELFNSPDLDTQLCYKQLLFSPISVQVRF